MKILRDRGGLETMKAKATGCPTLDLSAHSTGMVWSPYSVGIPQLSRAESHTRKGERGVQRYSLRIHIAAGEGVEAMEVKELFHRVADCSTLSIKLSLLRAR